MFLRPFETLMNSVSSVCRISSISPFFLKLDVCWSMLEGQKGKQMGSEDSQQSQEWRPLKMSSDTTNGLEV